MDDLDKQLEEEAALEIGGGQLGAESALKERLQAIQERVKNLLLWGIASTVALLASYSGHEMDT